MIRYCHVIPYKRLIRTLDVVVLAANDFQLCSLDIRTNSRFGYRKGIVTVLCVYVQVPWLKELKCVD